MDNMTTKEIHELIQLNEYRRNSYILLSRVFSSEVDSEFWNILSQNIPNIEESDELSRGFKLVYDYLHNPENGANSDLNADYVNVFIGFGKNLIGAFPYESYYTSTKRVLMQEAYDEMYDLLQAEHIRPVAVDLSPHDHASTELSLLAHYAGQAVDALSQQDFSAYKEIEAKYAKFFFDHPNKWMNQFGLDIIRIAETNFYKGFAYILNGLLEADKELLSEDE